ncbi:TraB/GumN family protein [Candidatus Aenigmatarchaeota archaeon]
MSRIILVPTSHVSAHSLKKVKEVIEREKPDCVAVELDMNRYASMKQHEEASTLEALRALGVTTFALYWILKRLQSWLGKKLGILPGSEMLKAVEISRKMGIKVALIDRDIGVTLFRLKSIPAREKLKLILYLFKGLTIDYLLLKMRKDKGTMAIDLTKVPPKDLIKQAMQIMKKEFPNLYNALVTERDRYMTDLLKNMSKKFDKIVVVIGAGHADGMKRLLGKK